MNTPDTKFYKFKMAVINNGKWKSILYKDIMCFKASGNYTQIFIFENNVIYNTSCSLIQLKKVLPDIFFACHRSNIVNMGYISEISKNHLMLNGNISLPLASKKRINLLLRLATLSRITIPNCNNCTNCEQLNICEDIHPFIKIMLPNS